MPDIILKISRLEAIDLHNNIQGMTGEVMYKATRFQIQKEIVKVWPEIENAAPSLDGETRNLNVNPKQQRSLAEGLLSLAMNPKSNNHDYDMIRKLALTCRLWNWVESHIEAMPVPEYDGALDNEPSLIDIEPCNPQEDGE